MAAQKSAKKYFFIKTALERDEFIRCSLDPVYFIYTYVRITHPVRGEIPFKLFPFQVSLLAVYLKVRYSVSLKPRQMGISTLVAAYALWLTLFHPHKYVLIVSIKQATARSLLRRIKFMYMALPEFLKMECTNGGSNQIGTADRIAFSNFSEISVAGSTDDAGRSDSLSCLIMDEVAFQKHASTTWGAAQQTLATGGQAIMLSTAFGVGNFFHTTYVEAMQGLNSFFPVRLNWQMHPERNMKWYLEQKLALGNKRLAQEIDCDFLQSGYTVFDMAKIRAIEDKLLEFGDPIEQRSMGNKTVEEGEFKIYFRPDPHKEYFIGGDIASGRARDYSTFSIFDEDGKEHACFKGKLGLLEYSKLLMAAGQEYNWAWLAPEVNALGEGVMARLQDEGYPNIFHSVSKTFKLGDFEREQNLIAGWVTSGKSRHEIITGMDDDLMHDLVDIYNPYFVQEGYTFIYNENNKPIALGKDSGRGGIRSSSMYEEEGAVSYTDDSILGACIGNEVRKFHKKGYMPMPISGGN